MQYPQVRRDDSVVEVLHGEAVADPYRWLEDVDSDETKEFVRSQAALTDSFLSSLPDRDKMQQALRATFDYEKIGCPGKHGDKYYYYYNTGVQQQSVLYRLESLNPGHMTKILDPNELSEDGTTGIGCSGFSESGKYFAYGLSTKGTDWRQVFVRDLTTLENLLDVVNWVKFSSITWTHDDVGFFYCRYQPPPGQEGAGMTAKAGSETHTNRNQRVCYHRLGTLESDDVVIKEDPAHDTWMFGATVTDDGAYVILSTFESCAPMNLIAIAPYHGNVSELRWTSVVGEWIAEYDYLCNDGNVFYFVTNRDAAKKKIVSTVFTPGTTTTEFVWRDVLAEDPRRVISHVGVIHNTVIVVYMEDVVERMYIGPLSDLKLKEVPLPTLGTVSAMKCERYKDWLFIKLTSYTTPGLILHTNMSPTDTECHLKVWKEEKVNNLDSNAFTARQMFYENDKDGTRIPLFLLSPKGLENETLPCIIYGYGGFNISMTPAFSTFRLTFVQKYRAHYAVACIRGGGEYGEDWHVGGSKGNKQNCFDDFQSAARFLVASKLTTGPQIGIIGGSNGGLLVAACANQTPELYGAVVSQVGVLDLYRFHKFTIGSAWISEYGNPDVAEDFAILKKYSPLHNIRPGVRYPNVMCMTGDHDDRVVPHHTFKYIATLQHVNPPGGRYFARIEMSVGHGATSPTTKRIEETAELYAFIAHSIGATWND